MAASVNSNCAPEGPLNLSRPIRRMRFRWENRRAGVNPAASVHWLRHAHASHAIDNGAPITLVSATLGHADLKTTSVYAHARPGESSGRYLKTK